MAKVHCVSYEGKTLSECVDILKGAYANGEMNLEVMMWAVESLQDSRKDMRLYFRELTALVVQDIVLEGVKGTEDYGTTEVKKGRNLLDVAEDLAYQHLRRLINHYNNEEIHKKWNAALPELKTEGGFAALF